MDYTMLYIWLGIFVVSLIVEVAVPGLVSLWFAVGALGAIIISIFLGSNLIWLQVLVFVVVTVASFFLFRPLLLKKRNPDTMTNADSLVGMIGFVEDEIRPYEVGSVRVSGLVWSAVLLDDSMKPIETGKKVLIKEIAGNKLKVVLAEEDTNA